MSGYFFEGSNPGGFRIQPLIFTPSKLEYQTSSGEGRSSCANNSSFSWVSAVAASPVGDDGSNRNSSPMLVGVDTRATPVVPSADIDQLTTS